MPSHAVAPDGNSAYIDHRACPAQPVDLDQASARIDWAMHVAARAIAIDMHQAHGCQWNHHGNEAHALGPCLTTDARRDLRAQRVYDEWRCAAFSPPATAPSADHADAGTILASVAR
ncbi:hypothetical protein [Paraburkholderia mimosarum]|uniref:hypothetical protein n=1 Tax=Paraburkholderia mimosarum TaxID=312026 RepID=UPI0004851357|nr:hypothetical protein [Paraburkholderia mimosarum]